MPESIDAVLERVVYQGTSIDGGNFVIGKILGGKSVKGDIHDPREGERYRFRGEWKAGNPKYGPEFVFTSCEVVVDMTASGVEQYLREYIEGLGTVKAAALVRAFGADTFDVLREDPGRAMEVPKITPAIVDAIRVHFENVAATDPAVEAKLIDLFRGHDFPRKTVKQVMRAFPSGAVAHVMKHPYQLLQFKSIGWKRVDSFATSAAKYDRSGIGRHCGGIVEAFEEMARAGHTCARRSEMDAMAGGLLGMTPDGAAWVALAADGKVVAHRLGDDGVRYVALGKYAGAELEIARRVVMLADAALPLPCEIEIDGLAGEQQEAVELIASSGVAILTGAPGTGKSYTAAKILQSMTDAGVAPSSILFVAPTGVAARRGSEFLDRYGVVGITCSTIHRALAPSPIAAPPGAARPDARKNRERQSFGFARNEANPLACQFIVIDEFSMTDVCLAASLFRAIRPGTRVLIVGDENQLPSVGPGAALRDLMAAGIPSYTLREIRRSASAGTVVHACHAIRDGHPPVPADRIDLAAHKNWVHLETDDPNAIADLVVDLHRSARTYDPVWQMQVVTPQHAKHPFSADPLNRRLAALLNGVAREAIEASESAMETRDYKKVHLPHFFRLDRVIRTENEVVNEMVNEDAYRAAHDAGEHWAKDPWKPSCTFRDRGYFLKKSPIVNGDMGIVIDIEAFPRVGLQVVLGLKNPDRMVRLPYGEAKIGQAYALTCHRVQGAGFPYVIIPVHHCVYSGLLTREWIYTAISRTQTLCVTVGQMSAIEAAVGRKTVHLRKTRLRELVRAEMAAAGARRAAGEAGELVAVGGPAGDDGSDDGDDNDTQQD